MVLRRESEAEGAVDSSLPGPCNTGYDPGVRRRRSRISSVPTSAILPDTGPLGAGAASAEVRCQQRLWPPVCLGP